EALLAPAVTRRLIDEFARLRPQPAPRPERLEELTTRETEVLRLVAEGVSNGENAQRPRAEGGTGKKPRRRLAVKVGPAERTPAGGTAYESGLVVPRAG